MQEQQQAHAEINETTIRFSFDGLIQQAHPEHTD
jgi:hypothetical protein